MQPNTSNLKALLGRVTLVAVGLPSRTLADIEAANYARGLNDTLGGFEAGTYSEEDTRIKLKGLEFSPTQIADVLAARRKRLSRLREVGR